MSLLLMFIGGMTLLDAFGHKGWDTRSEWQAGVGVAIMLIGAIILIAREWED